MIRLLHVKYWPFNQGQHNDSTWWKIVRHCLHSVRRGMAIKCRGAENSTKMRMSEKKIKLKTPINPQLYQRYANMQVWILQRYENIHTFILTLPHYEDNSKLVFHMSEGGSEIELKHCASSKTNIEPSRKYFAHLNGIRLATNSRWLDSSMDRKTARGNQFFLVLCILCRCFKEEGL